MVILTAGGSDVGRKRAHNEDCFGVFDDLGLYVVADGMGGHAAGEVASKLAVDTLRDFITETARPEKISWPFEPDVRLSPSANRLVVGIKLANHAIFKHAQERPERKGMGTTIVAALKDGDDLYLAHVGDSRAYVLSRGAIIQLTGDHSYVEEMVTAGLLTHEQARVHPLRNIITRALGTKGDVKVDLSRQPLKPGDIYLLCSDGLSGMLSDPEIAHVMGDNAENLTACIDTLIQGANRKGGDDNITAVVLRVV